MGTWGTGSFENDDAADFMIDVLDSGDLSLIREALDNVLTSTEYVEAPDATLAIVAAEIVAAARGRPTLADQIGVDGRPDARSDAASLDHTVTRATTRRTQGATSVTAMKATGHVVKQLRAQVTRKSGRSPWLTSNTNADTSDTMIADSRAPNSNGAKRTGIRME